MVGQITVAGAKDSTPKVERHTVYDFGERGGFAFAGKISRCEGKVEQRVAMISLPDAPVLYVEQLRARTAIDVREVATARFALLNEDDKLFESNERRIWTAEGEHLMRGAVKEPLREHIWNTSWANLDDKLSVVAHASGKMSYQENHKVERARLHQMLSANHLADVGNRQAGEIFSEAVVGWQPNAAHTTKTELKVERIGADGFDLRLGGWRILVNLGDAPMEFKTPGRKSALSALSAVIETAR
jgi:hypothetical protein